MHASLPVSVVLSTRERGFLRVLAEARRNALAIIPALCLKQPIVSGKVAFREGQPTGEMNGRLIRGAQEAPEAA